MMPSSRSWKISFVDLVFLSALALFSNAAPVAAQSAAVDSTAAVVKAPARPRPKAPGPALWIHFDRNADRLTSPAAIQAVVDSAWGAGFTRLIVDVKKPDGSVAFKSRRAPMMNLPFDYFGAFRQAADAHGMETIAEFDVFTEGDTRTKKGPAYDHPEWQTVVGNVETGLMPQSEYFQAGPVLFANPCSPAVQQYEVSAIEDLLDDLKPSALLLNEVRFFTRDADMSDSTHIQFETWAGLSHMAPDPANPNETCWPGSVQKTNSPRMPQWATFRIGVIHEFLGRVRRTQKEKSPSTALYLAALGYYEPAINLGLNWQDPGYKSFLWYASDRFNRMGVADLVDQIVVLNRDANPRAVSEVVRGARIVTQDRVPEAVLIDAGQHVKSPNRFRECLQTVRDLGLGVVVTDMNQLGPMGYWAIVGDEFPRN